MDSSINSEAVRLAQESDWKSLQRLLERDPAMAKQRGDHGMLPIHWACTVCRVPLSLIAKLLQAYPDGVRAKNDGELLPLHIAIRANLQASCIRKLVRAYPEAVSERTPDGISALELAQEMELDADSLKVLYRARDRTGVIQQQNDENSSSCEQESADFGLKRALGGQEEGEASGVERPVEEEEEEGEDNEWNAVVPDSYLTNAGFGGFLHVGDDRGLGAIDRSTLEPEGSISMMSEQSLSDIDGFDTPHDHLVSPSSTSTCSQDEPSTPLSSRSSFSTTGRCTGSRRGLLSGGFQNQTRRKSHLQQERMQHAAALLVQLQNNGAVSNRELRTMVTAMSAGTIVGNTDEVASSRSHSRNLSLPVMPSHVNLRQNSSFQCYDRADDEDEQDDNNNVSHRGNTRTKRDAADGQVDPRDRFFHSVQGNCQRSAPRNGSQRASPPLFARSHHRDSHDSNGQGQFDPPPEWKHDDECSICRASFGMFKHRHHCRNCGKSICSQHSADKKISMEAKGFTTPQRVCVTCYAMITHSRSLKHESELEYNVREGSLLNPVAFQQQQHALTLGVGGSDRYGAAIPSFPSSTVPLPNRSIAFGDSRSPSTSDGSPHASPTTGHIGSSFKSSVLAAGEATGGTGERATTNHASRLSGATSSAVHELRSLLASQQKQIEQLAQSNMQMQQQLLEQEELKAETMLLITQLMTRVSMLELQKDNSSRTSKRRSAGTGESEDEDEELPQDDLTSFDW